MSGVSQGLCKVKFSRAADCVRDTGHTSIARLAPGELNRRLKWASPGGQVCVCVCVCLAR